MRIVDQVRPGTYAAETAYNPNITERVRSTSPGWSARITSLAARFWSRMRRKREVRLAITRLDVLDDRTLKDIGLHRSQVESAVTHRERYGFL